MHIHRIERTEDCEVYVSCTVRMSQYHDSWYPVPNNFLMQRDIYSKILNSRLSLCEDLEKVNVTTQKFLNKNKNFMNALHKSSNCLKINIREGVETVDATKVSQQQKYLASLIETNFKKPDKLQLAKSDTFDEKHGII